MKNNILGKKLVAIVLLLVFLCTSPAQLLAEGYETKRLDMESDAKPYELLLASDVLGDALADGEADDGTVDDDGSVDDDDSVDDIDEPEEQLVLEAPTFTTRSKHKGMAILSWKKVKNADGLEVYIKKGSGSYQFVNSFQNIKDTLYFFKLKAGKKYSFRIRAYAYSNGETIYSEYTTKTLKISKKTAKVTGGDYKAGSIYGPSLSAKELADVKKAVAKFKTYYYDETMSDFIKVKLAHDYICDNCSYAASWAEHKANTAWGALVYGEAQCSGYSRAFVALCDATGLKSKYVHANSKSINPSHQFNMVKVGKKWYIIDVQCNDSSGFYAVFLVSAKTYKKLGIRWDEKKYPKCKKDYKW